MKPLLVAALAGVALAATAQSFVKAQFIFFRSNDGKTLYNPPRQFIVTKPADLAKLTKLLPGIGYPKGGLKPGGWDGWGTVRLMRAKGHGISIFFPADGKVFSIVGIRGDFPARKGFDDYLLDIERQAKQ